jgi:hypothetical protein
VPADMDIMAKGSASISFISIMVLHNVFSSGTFNMNSALMCKTQRTANLIEYSIDT